MSCIYLRLRRRHPVARLHEARLVLLADDVHAELDALVANEHRRARDELADLVLALAAERAVEGVLGVAVGFAHSDLVPRRLGVAATLLSRRRQCKNINPSLSLSVVATT